MTYEGKGAANRKRQFDVQKLAICNTFVKKAIQKLTDVIRLFTEKVIQKLTDVHSCLQKAIQKLTTVIRL